MSDNFAEIEGGGSMLVAWQVRDKRVLVVGGGEVAAGRIVYALNADARVTVVCPRSGLGAEVAHRLHRGQVQHVDRDFEPSDLDGADMVLAAIDDPEASSRIWKLCHERRIPANIADVPPECDFFFGSTIRDGPVQIMVSTNGCGPRLAAILRRRLAAAMPPTAGRAAASVGTLRRGLRAKDPDTDHGPVRMRWMSRLCDSWSLDELAELQDKDREALLALYPGDVPPSLRRLRGQPDFDHWEFDGSFGWL